MAEFIRDNGTDSDPALGPDYTTVPFMRDGKQVINPETGSLQVIDRELTDKQKKVKLASIAADEIEHPQILWRDELVIADSNMSRQTEDIIDSMTASQKERLPQFIRDNYDDKKTLRGQKP